MRGSNNLKKKSKTTENAELPEKPKLLEFPKKLKLLELPEKPENPKSNYAVTGLYIYDKNVFDIIKKLKPSGRGELEITDVNNAYIKQGKMEYSILEGFWTDAGTPESLLLAAKLVKKKNEK